MKQKQVFRNLLNPQSLTFKIFAYNFLIVCIGFGFFSLVLLNLNINASKDKAVSAAYSSLKQSATYLEAKTSSIRNSMDAITLNAQVNEILNTDTTKRYLTIPQWLEDYHYLQDLIYRNIYNYDLMNIMILTENEFGKTVNNSLAYDLSTQQNTPWYENAMVSMNSYFWHFPSELDLPIDQEKYICFTRNLAFAYDNYKTFFIGIVDKSLFANLLNVNVSDQYTSYFLVNSAKNIMSFSDDYDLAQTDAILQEVQGYLDQDIYRIWLEETEINHQKYILGAAKIPKTDLTLIYTYSYYQMVQDIVHTTLKNSLSVMLVALPVILLFSALISSSITKRLWALTNHMRQVSTGDLNVSILPSDRNDEVGILTRQFNYMLTKISMLVDSQYTYGKRIKELELIALQTQINPHFLYNTLDLIKWKASKLPDPGIRDLITALSKYYKMSLNKGQDIVTIESELQHISSYVYIQNQRFDDCMDLHVEIDSSFYHYKIPKITFQPLIENAILHGILEKDDPQGTIRISAKKQDDTVTISISDDGVGMDQKTVEGLLTQSPNTGMTGSGYGLKNIDERLKLIFGSQYGLHFHSTVGTGTTVDISIAAIPFPDKNP